MRFERRKALRKRAMFYRVFILCTPREKLIENGDRPISKRVTDSWICNGARGFLNDAAVADAGSAMFILR